MMELFFFCLYGMLRFGCEVFPTPPDGIVLRQFLLPLTQFLDSHFQPCGAEEATFITLPCDVPPPSNTVLIGRYQYVPKCLGREPADNEGQKAPVLDGQDQVSVLFQRGWSDPSCFGFVNNKVAPPAAPGTLSFPAYEPAPNVSGTSTRVRDTDRNGEINHNHHNEKPPTVKSVPANDGSKPDHDENGTIVSTYQIFRREDGYHVLPPKMKKSIRATNFLLNLGSIKHRHNADGHEEKELLCRLLIPFHSSSQIEVDANDIGDILGIVLKRYPEAIIYDNKDLGEFKKNFQIQLREKLISIPHTHEICFSGWTVDHEGKWLYSEDGQRPADENIKLHSGFSFCRGKMPRDDDQIVKDGWGILGLTKKLEAIAVPVLFSLLALCFHLFEAAGFPPRSLLFIEGPTGSLKTAVASLLFNWSGKSEHSIPATFRDTTASMELKFSKYRDQVLLVDDFSPAADTASKRTMERTLETIIRFFGDGIARGRATPTMDEVKEFKPSGLVAFTGEDSAGSQSSMLRCLYLAVQKQTFDKDILRYYQIKPFLWTEFLALFAERLAPEANSVISFIREQVGRYRADYDMYFSEKRLLDAFACLATTADLAVRIMPEGLQPEYDVTLREAVFNVCKASEEHAKAADPVRLFCQSIMEAQQQNRIHIATVSKFVESPDQYLGCEKNGFWFLWPHNAYETVCKAYSAVGKIFPKTETALWRDLASAGVLINTISHRKDGDRPEYCIKVSFGERPRMLKINPDRLRAIAEDEEV